MAKGYSYVLYAFYIAMREDWGRRTLVIGSCLAMHNYKRKGLVEYNGCPSFFAFSEVIN